MELFGKPIIFTDRIPEIEGDLGLIPSSRFLGWPESKPDGIIPAIFVGGPNDGNWGMMKGDLDWPEEGGTYRQTEEMKDNLTIWRWETRQRDV